MVKNALFCILISLVIVSCSTIKKNEDDKITVANNINSLPDWKIGLKNLDFDAKLSVNYNNQSYPASAKIKIANLDSLSLVISGPFGIPIGKLYAEPDNFIFFNAISNQIIEGVPSSENFNSVIKIPLNYIDFIRFMRCETPDNPKDFIFVKKLNNKKNETLFKNELSKDYIEYVVISLIDSTISQYQRKLRNGKLILHILYENYRTINNIKYSMKQLYKFPEINSSMSLEVNNININSYFSKPFRTTFPDDIDKIKLDN